MKFFLMALFCWIFGYFMRRFPEKFYTFTEGWKHKNSDGPSDAYVANTRFGGLMFYLVGVLAILAIFFG